MVVGLLSLALAGSLGAVTIIPSEWSVALDGDTEKKDGVVVQEAPRVKHVPTPESVKGIYMSQCVVGTPSFRDSLVALIDETELNSVVIDIKDFTGKIAFPSDNPVLAHSVSDECGARDMKAFVEKLHEKGIYVIGRITVFQDPYYTKLHPEQAVQSISRPGEPWKDYKGLSFIDVSSRPYWDYVVQLSKEAHEVIGFDELNYDYVRYPSDGPMKDAKYVNPNRSEALEIFFAYLHQEVAPTGVVMSADLFGMTTTNTDDLNIGQQLERALPYFDYIMPMVYPSHYPKNFRDLGNPNNYPYEIIKISMGAAVERTIATTTAVRTLSGVPIASTTPQLYTKKAEPAHKMRPWLQDFDYGKDYTPDDIRAQIRGANDVGLTSWVFWDAGNKYSSLRKYLSQTEALGN